MDEREMLYDGVRFYFVLMLRTGNSLISNWRNSMRQIKNMVPGITLRATLNWGTRMRLAPVLFAILFAWQNATPARAADGPTLNKTRIFVMLLQSDSYWPPKATQEQYNTTSWLPDVRFRITGPLPGGSQLVVDVAKPDGSPWVSLDCPTAEMSADESLEVVTPRDPPEG